MTVHRRRSPAAALLRVAAGALLWPPASAAAQPPADGPEALVREGATVRVSEHVHVIPDGGVRLVANVGIVTGDRATLVVETGLGPINAQTILREVAKVSRGGDLYVASTHFHPEHAAGEMAFPGAAIVVRARAQQQDIDERGADTLLRFRGFSPLVEELLAGVRYREADVIFEREHAIDLGGVRVRLMALGPTHTRGDTMAYVEEDGVLLAGDVVMNRQFLVFVSPESSVAAWRAVLGEIAALRPRHVVPSHGAMGDGSLIGAQQAYLETLEARVRAHKAAGRPADETAELAAGELQEAYPDWTGARWIAPAARAAFREAP